MSSDEQSTGERYLKSIFLQDDAAIGAVLHIKQQGAEDWAWMMARTFDLTSGASSFVKPWGSIDQERWRGTIPGVPGEIYVHTGPGRLCQYVALTVDTNP